MEAVTAFQLCNECAVAYMARAEADPTGSPGVAMATAAAGPANAFDRKVPK